MIRETTTGSTTEDGDMRETGNMEAGTRGQTTMDTKEKVLDRKRPRMKTAGIRIVIIMSRVDMRMQVTGTKGNRIQNPQHIGVDNTGGTLVGEVEILVHSGGTSVGEVKILVHSGGTPMGEVESMLLSGGILMVEVESTLCSRGTLVAEVEVQPIGVIRTKGVGITVSGKSNRDGDSKK